MIDWRSKVIMPLYAERLGHQDIRMKGANLYETRLYSVAVVMLGVLLASCSKRSGVNGAESSAEVKKAAVLSHERSPGSGRVAYMLLNKGAFVVQVRKGGGVQSISNALNALSKGEDETLHLARDGSWIALTTTRFGCDGWACLAAGLGEFSSAHKVQPGGKDVHPEGPIAIAPAGAFIVYGEKGPHERDLFVTRRQGQKWTAPKLLTASSKFEYNAQPAISHDGKKVLFDCGSVPYGQEGTGICEVNVDGSGLREVLRVGSGWASDVKAMHHADYAPDGSIVFEAERTTDGERIWRLPVGKKQPVRLGDFGNDNSPCVLPDGRIVSLWLERRGSDGKHEMKLMKPDGQLAFMVMEGEDVLDTQISCSL